MGKTLIIAEKPSVASDIAKALGGFKKADDYYESDNYVVSSAVGHLLTIVPPEGVEAARGKWTFKCLPVIPPHFDLEPIEIYGGVAGEPSLLPERQERLRRR